MRRSVRWLGVVLSLVLGATAGAQNASRPAEVEVNVLAAGGPTRLGPIKQKQVDGTLAAVGAGKPVAVERETVTLKLICDVGRGVDCTRMSATVGGAPAVASNQNANTVTFTTLLTTVAPDIQLLENATAIGTVSFTVSPPNRGGGPSALGQGTHTLAELVEASQSCEFSGADAARVAGYDEGNNLARVMVRPNGNLLSRLPRDFDEDDTLEVIIVLREALLPYIQVRRKSEFGTVGNIRILGSGVEIPSDLLDRQSTEEDERTLGRCTVYTVPLRDFAPGKGEVEILASRNGQTTTLGTFEFNVHTLYTGMFSLGPVWTWNEDPKPGLVFNGTQSIIANRERDDQRMLFALFYTPFVWGKRDIEKSRQPLFALNRLNPTLGVSLSDLPNNALLGVSWDVFNGAVLTAGMHLSRVTVLSPESGLKVGDPFTAPAEQLPTVREWRAKGFIALSVDLRAAVQLVRTALTATPASK